MTVRSTFTVTATSPVTTNSWMRRLAVRATVSTFMLATSLVGLAGMASASPEMGC